MYGAPYLGYGCEIVHSFNTLIDAIKRRQLLRPRSKLAINLVGGDIEVNLLTNGFVELDGKVQPVAVEKEIEDAMQQFGAVLKEVLV